MVKKMASGDVSRFFDLREDITPRSLPSLRGAAAKDADNLKSALRLHRIGFKESAERVYANGVLSQGYAPRRIEAMGSENVFRDYSREITTALGTWYVAVSGNGAHREDKKQPA